MVSLSFSNILLPPRIEVSAQNIVVFWIQNVTGKKDTYKEGMNTIENGEIVKRGKKYIYLKKQVYQPTLTKLSQQLIKMLSG